MNAENPQIKTTKNLPSMVANSVTEKTSYGLGCTTTNREDAEIIRGNFNSKWAS